MSKRLYCGDIVWTSSGRWAIIRQIEGDRARIQIGDDWTWAPIDDLRWLGHVLEGRLPRRERRWKRIGRAITKGRLRD